MSLSNVSIKNINFEDILNIGATYGVVQILANDLADSGVNQSNLLQAMPVQMFLIYSGAFSVTNNHKIAIISIVLYYLLKKNM